MAVSRAKEPPGGDQLKTSRNREIGNAAGDDNAVEDDEEIVADDDDDATIEAL